MTLPNPILRLASALLLLVAFAGCSDLGAPVAPRIVLSESAVAFGSTVVGGSVVRTLSVSNTGTGELRGEATIASCDGFAITAGGGAFNV
ncbi:MAG: hypothetical protein RL721_1929, partial [Candidatus Eisenbacteria bacterium]